MKLADLTAGDVVEDKKTGFTWVVFRVEPVTRMLQWAPMVSSMELTHVPIKPRWSPPYDLEDWTFERDSSVRRRVR